MTRPAGYGATRAWDSTQPVAVKPFRDRYVKVREVACPSCGAGPGQKCRNGAGHPSSPHVGRRRMALRAERATT